MVGIAVKGMGVGQRVGAWVAGNNKTSLCNRNSVMTTRMLRTGVRVSALRVSLLGGYCWHTLIRLTHAHATSQWACAWQHKWR